MAQTSYPFDGMSVSETQFSTYFREFADTGVAASADSLALKVSATGSNMQVQVQPGFAIVRGFAYNSSAVEPLTISASASQARVDRIVLRLDPTLNSIVLAVMPGTPGSMTPASLTQTEGGVYEMPLAEVTVGANVTSIAPGVVTDSRPFNGLSVSTWSTETRPTAPRFAKMGLNTTTSSWEYWNGSAWVPLAPSVAWSSITGRPATFPPDAHTQDWSTVTGKPSTYPPDTHSHAFSSITGRPATYPPDAHSHTWTSVTGKPTTFTPATHGHDPSDVGIRVGSLNFGTVNAGDEKTVTIGKASNEVCIVTINHSSAYLYANAEAISATQVRVKVRNGTSSTDHSGILVTYALIRAA